MTLPPLLPLGECFLVCLISVKQLSAACLVYHCSDKIQDTYLLIIITCPENKYVDQPLRLSAENAGSFLLSLCTLLISSALPGLGSPRRSWSQHF